MLSADLLEKQSKREEAISYVLRADSIVSATKNYEWEARICGFLSTQYRIMGLIDQGKRYLDKGLRASDKITPRSASDQYKGMVYQEMAHYAMYDEDYAEAVRLLQKVAPLFSGLKNEAMKNYFFGNNEEMLGRSYLGLKDYNTATDHYKKALEFLKKANAGDSQWAGMVYHGLGKIALENKKYPESLHYLQKSDTIAEAMDHISLKELVYRDLGEYYKATGNIDDYTRYNTKYLQILKVNIKAERVARNGAMNRSYNQQQAGFSSLHMIIFSISVLFLLISLLYYFTRKKRKQEREQYKATIAKLNASKEKVEDQGMLQATEDEKEVRFMPLETEKTLLKKLKKFEAKNEFINPDLNLSLLAVDLKTNTKYLSHIINTHKKKDFNNYVNELRVFYIIQKIQEDPKYLNYKISYLSEESGFSSHSKFTTIFKNTTGLTPSAFLHQVRIVDVKEKVTD